MGVGGVGASGSRKMETTVLEKYKKEKKEIQFAIEENNWSIWFQILDLTSHSFSHQIFIEPLYLLGTVLVTKDSAVNKTSG